jgi:hypothetical protein
MDPMNTMFFAWQDGLVRPAAETVKEHFDIDASEATMRLHIRRSVERPEQEAAAEEAQAARGEMGETRRADHQARP